MIVENLTPKQLADAHVDLARKVCCTFVRDGKWREYMASAYMGLLQAANRYKPNPKATFVTYATRRIRGAIQDQMRNETSRTNRPRRRRVATINNPTAGFEFDHLAAKPETYDPVEQADSVAFITRACINCLSATRPQTADRLRRGMSMLAEGHKTMDASLAVGWSGTVLHNYLGQMRTNLAKRRYTY